MKNPTKIEDLIQAAKRGDKMAEAEFFEKLFVRFLSIVTRKLKKCSILKNRINLDEKSREICQCAVDKVKALYPFNNPQWSLMSAMSVLQNVLDGFIIETLTDMAKKGDSKAENWLFAIIRKKLMERVKSKNWKEMEYEG